MFQFTDLGKVAAIPSPFEIDKALCHGFDFGGADAVNRDAKLIKSSSARHRVREKFDNAVWRFNFDGRVAVQVFWQRNIFGDESAHVPITAQIPFQVNK